MIKKISFLLFSIAALVIAVAAAVLVWFVIQNQYVHPTTTQPTTVHTDQPGTSAAATSSGAAIVIPTSKLTDGQKAFAKTMGLDVSNGLVITQTQYQCAVGKLGTTRMQEIINGSTPSFSEGLALMSCK